MGRDTELYSELLAATIGHLERLRSRGIRFVPVAKESLEALSRNKRTPRAGKIRPRVLQSSVSTFATPAETPRTSQPGAVPIQSSTTNAPSHRGEGTIVIQPTDRGSAFSTLRNEALACTRCPHLAASRRNVVFGVGSMEAELMFVGEAPGADEDLQGEPFVGLAGQLLTKIIQTMGLSRETVYIANILKCRPDTPGQTTGNRKPTPEEMQTCLPYLEQQIDLIGPKVIVALGATAVEGLLGKTAGITRVRGNWHSYRGIPLMPTYHPAYLLRNQALSEKRRVWEDMLQVLEKLARPISEKQRGYFLKANG